MSLEDLVGKALFFKNKTQEDCVLVNPKLLIDCLSRDNLLEVLEWMQSLFLAFMGFLFLLSLPLISAGAVWAVWTPWRWRLVLLRRRVAFVFGLIELVGHGFLSELHVELLWFVGVVFHKFVPQLVRILWVLSFLLFLLFLVLFVFLLFRRLLLVWGVKIVAHHLSGHYIFGKIVHIAHWHLLALDGPRLVYMVSHEVIHHIWVSNLPLRLLL